MEPSNGGTPNPGAVAPDSAAGAAPDSAAPAAPAAFDWAAHGLDQETLGFVQNKGFKGPSDVLAAYRNLEKLMGAGPDKLLKLPADDKPESWAQVWEKLGRPADPSKYEISMPDNFEDHGLGDFLRSTFHELGISGKQAQVFSQKLNEHLKGNLEKAAAEFQQQIAAQEVALKQEWGNQFDRNVRVAKQAAQAFGVKPEVIDTLEEAMGFDGVMKFFHAIGSKMGEAQYVDSGQGNTGGFGMSKEAALSEINRLRSDVAFAQKLSSGDAEAKRKWDNLHQIAFS